MEIHFCDICNESVPQADLDQGRAFVRKGRVLCAKCDRAMGDPGLFDQGAEGSAGDGGAQGDGGMGAAAAPVRHPRSNAVKAGAEGGGGGGVLVGLVALVFAAGSTAVVVGRIEEVKLEADGRYRSIAENLNDATGKVDRVQQRVADGIARLDSDLRGHFDGQKGEIEGVLANLRAEMEARGQRIAALGDSVAALETELASDSGKVAKRIAAVDDEFSGLVKDLDFQRNRLIELEERVHGLATGGGLAAALNQPQADGQPAWHGLLADLGSSQAGIRLEAIYALGETGDQAVVPYIIPMLKDVDLFVRMATARMLEDLNARTAVPALIDALEDTETAVMESSMLALRKITGRSFNFEPSAPLADRARRVKAWRDWWKKEGDAFLAGGEPS